MQKESFEINEELRFAQSVCVTSGDAKTIYVSGQVGESEGLRSQSIEVFTNLKNQLAAAGAQTTDVVKLTIYVVDYAPNKADDVLAGIELFVTDLQQPPSATMVGVQSLFLPNFLIEVEAVAVVAG